MDDLIYYKDGTPAGVIAPSTVFTFQNSDILINGPAAISSTPIADDAGFYQALLQAGSLTEGSPNEIQKVLKMLADPTTSRTVSYLLCSAKKCTDIIDDIHSLSEASVMIVGCGGIGSSLCMLLAGVGIRNFTLIDSDVIEKSNLNRQFFWTLSDIGEKKIQVLKNSLEARFDGIDVKCIDEAVSIADICEKTVKNVRAVAITADNPSSLARDGWQIAEHCGVPVISGGYMHHLCSSFRFVPGDCHVVKTAAGDIEDEDWSSLPNAIMPSYGPMNLSLAAELSASLICSIATRTFGPQRTTIRRWDSRVA